MRPREVSFALSSRFEQFGAFTYGLKVCRQLSIVFRCLMKRQCVCRCKFQCHCLIQGKIMNMPVFKGFVA
ncbi:hypothetical protein DLR73_17995, partial [Vibrio paracholerae]|uniref:DUF3709 domain-containing protein n=1 Tax=Vibrio paracholerae TaxID=650003 RepID=UPI000DE2345D